MTSLFTSPSGYSSCIKIAGIPILPPLITDERRSQLKEEKAKALEIEKRIKRKRTSIDSGVMTGSYIENFKNSETLLADSSTFEELSISDLPSNGNTHFSDKSLSEINSKDSFLKAALEDSEFRDFFYSTAERIFKDNNMLDKNGNNHCDNSLTETNNHDKNGLYNIESDIKESTNVIGNTSLTYHSQPSKCLELEKVSNCGAYTSFDNEINKGEVSEKDVKLPCVEVENQASSPHEQRVRRNSYTLDSPSPILLEHMAKANSPGQKCEHWQILPEKKEKGLGFKAFLATKKPRKTWNKSNNIESPVKLANSSNTKLLPCVPKKSNTFVKTDKQHINSNHSLPCSSRSSPTRLSTFAYSSDCIQSVHNNSVDCINTSLKSHRICNNNKELNMIQQPETTERHKSESKITEKNNELCLESSTKNPLNTLPTENTSVSSYPNYETLEFFPSQVVPTSKNIDQPLCIQQNSDSGTNKENLTLETQKEYLNDLDDTISVCSSLSLSKFLPNDDHVSRPSTGEDLSALFCELQLRHERQIAELLEMQHKEKILLSKLHSNCGSIASRSTATSSISEISFDHNSIQVTGPKEKKTPCSRELFPPPDTYKNPEQLMTAKEVKSAVHYKSEIEKIAALKLTACVRGYLTRRLLKTEKVKQLIDTIKESLNCAFLLQSETELRRNDLELHERLAHQLTAALYELQTIISAPVATRMAIIATDREKLRKPVSRPSSAISSATQKSILRRQKSMNCSEKKSQEKSNTRNHEIRPRTKSLCLLGTSGAGSNEKNVSTSILNINISKKPWR